MKARTPARRATTATRCVPATPSRWRDVERLFGDKGACAGCWCMWPRLSSAEFRRGRGAGNRRALERLVGSGARPGPVMRFVARQPRAGRAKAVRRG